MRTIDPIPTCGPVAIEFTTTAPLAARVTVHDLRGRAVRTLDLGTVEPGRQSALWDGLDGDGRRVSAGVYFVRIEGAGEVLATRRIVRLSD